MERTIRIALAQINSTLGDFSGNTNLILDAIEHGLDQEADIVVFPEMALCGYPPEDLLLRQAFIRDCEHSLKKIIKKTDGIHAVIGFPHFFEDGLYNASAIIENREWIDTYCKAELPNYGVFDEKRYFVSGNSPSHFMLKDYRLAVTICEDIWIEDGKVEQWIRNNQADIVINISASPFHAGKWALRQKIISSFAKRTNTLLLYLNLIGGQDELVFDGGSMVIDSSGKLHGIAKQFEEDFLVVDISQDGIRIQNTKRAQLDSIEEVFAALVLGTRDYIQKNKFKKAVIGLSGGIDSSLVAAIATEAIGSENVIGVTMPSKYSSKATRSDAESLAKNLRIRFMEIPIQKIFASSVETIFGESETGKFGIEIENLQARIRGNILMTLSNKHSWLVLSTGNKSEMAVGYATLYGDMCGGYAVIKDVPKTMVFRLAEFVNRKASKKIIPQSVIERPPSAELRPDQKDEDSLPPYSTLDSILQAYIERDMAPDEIVAEGFEPEVVKQVILMVDRSEFKRRQAPPGVKITPKAFGRDRRLPISNQYIQSGSGKIKGIK